MTSIMDQNIYCDCVCNLCFKWQNVIQYMQLALEVVGC